MSDEKRLWAQLQGIEVSIDELKTEYDRGRISIGRYLQIKEKYETHKAVLEQELDKSVRDQRTLTAAPPGHLQRILQLIARVVTYWRDSVRATLETMRGKVKLRGKLSDLITRPQDPRRSQFVPFPRYGNPYNPGPPVKKDDMFYGRESSVDEIIAELRGLHQDNIIVLYGQRRTGKTSLLYALRRRLTRDAVYLPVFFDAQGRSTPLSLFWGLAIAISDTCQTAGLDVAKPHQADFERDAYAQFENGFLHPLTSRLNGRRLMLMLDEFESLEESVRTLGDNIFPFFRHLMQHQEALSFIFCGSHQLHELTRDYWSIFFNAARPIHVSFLDEDSTRALITEPVEGHFSYDELALRRLWALTHGHPYFVQYLCYEMVNLINDERKKGYVTVQDVNETLERFIKLGNDHMVDYVWSKSSEAQRAALLALLDVRQPVGERVASRRRVAQRAAQVHPTEADDIGPALEQLIERELLWGDEHRIGFTMELVAEWLQTKRSWYDLTGQLTWPGI